MRIRLLLYFARKIAVVNAVLSLFAAGLLSSATALYYGTATVSSALIGASAIGLTVGFVLAVYVYLLFRRNEMPLFYNHGLPLLSCIGGSYAVHVAVLVPVLALGLALRQMGGP